MDLVLVFTLFLCWGAAESRSYWSEKPSLLVSSYEIPDGESVALTCLLPIDYGGGKCRLYRRNQRFPLREVRESDWACVFNLTSAELLGRKPVGSRMMFTCDYHLQQYTSIHSDIKGVTVTGSRPSPGLSISGGRVVTLSDHVAVNCSPPVTPVSSCVFYSNNIFVAEGSCSVKLTGKTLAKWEKPALLLPVNLTCEYLPFANLEVRSEASPAHLLLVTDPAQASSSMICLVQVEQDQLEAFGDDSRTFVGEDGQMIRVQVSNRNQTRTRTLDCVQRPDTDP